SWIVMASKAVYVSRLARANARFLEAFKKIALDPSLIEEGHAGNDRVLRDSSLYRIYRRGAEEIRGRFVDLPEGRPKVLSAQSIAAIKAGLDSSLIRESQRLNRLMVVLTIAISGGPFLGLLGTVVGVMITFAAIAASGDVNVNAIAPGI